jgi:putative transposase
MSKTNGVPEDVLQFLETTKDVREYRHAIAVKLVFQGYLYEVIADMLSVSIGYITQAKQAYVERGVDGLRTRYVGPSSYLSDADREMTIMWIKEQQTWSIKALKQYISQQHHVTYKSDQSYYALFAAAGITYKQTQAANPHADAERVAAKKEITALCATHADALQTGKVAVLFVDQCHLVWGDACGYAWGPSGQRITLPIPNTRERQTYYGALNPKTREIHSLIADTGDGYWTTLFVTLLCDIYPDTRIILLWDGASYHRGEEMRSYLEALNHGLPATDWRVTCVQFAPHAPEQNPIEHVWLQAKEWVRKNWQRCTNTFVSVKDIFEEALERFEWNYEKLFMYTPFLKPQ